MLLKLQRKNNKRMLKPSPHWICKTNTWAGNNTFCAIIPHTWNEHNRLHWQGTYTTDECSNSKKKMGFQIDHQRTKKSKNIVQRKNLENETEKKTHTHIFLLLKATRENTTENYTGSYKYINTWKTNTTKKNEKKNTKTNTQEKIKTFLRVFCVCVFFLWRTWTSLTEPRVSADSSMAWLNPASPPYETSTILITFFSSRGSNKSLPYDIARAGVGARHGKSKLKLWFKLKLWSNLKSWLKLQLRMKLRFKFKLRLTFAVMVGVEKTRTGHWHSIYSTAVYMYW